jgi:phosphopantothenoylcysteine decarboxylase / phosphopantothenate---cysteine ligase
MLEGKKILLGVTGSIAAYKSATLIRLLVKAGADVKVIMTPSAKSFISPLTLSTLSKHPVLHELSDETTWANHVMLGRWADVMLMAPLSCNTLSKMAQGACDNLLMAVYLSATCPVVVAPAMDEDMWKHPSTKINLDKIQSFGNKVIPVAHGELASGLIGDGRMAEPEAIVAYLKDNFFSSGPLAGLKALVTAGPTHEPIDPVRFIGNHSSGKMGVALAQSLRQNGAEVTLVLGPSSTNLNLEGLHTMYAACHEVYPETTVAVMAAAVADYTPAEVASEKIKKKDGEWSLQFQKTKDILKSLGDHKKSGQFLVGFALETTNEEAYALGKLESKHADMIVMNSLQDKGAGFGHDTNQVTVFLKGGDKTKIGLGSKQEVAGKIVELIIKQVKR